MDAIDRIFVLVDQKYDEQRQFAAALGVAPSAVSNWRTRKSASYSKRLPQIAEVLNTSVEYLLTGEKKDSPAASVGGPATKEALQAAFWGGEKDLSQEDLDAMWADVERFAQFIAEKKKQERQGHD